MEIVQTYDRPSSATLDPGMLGLEMSVDRRRPPVAIDAEVDDSLSFARLMLALYELVSGDLRSSRKDYSAYQAWVTERYLEDIGPDQAALYRDLPALTERQKELTLRVGELKRETAIRAQTLAVPEFYKARKEYFNWLRVHDSEAWWILDPVVSVHRDCVIFEAFSRDESSYGRLTVPMGKLKPSTGTIFGTTNIDYSKALADEFHRVRNYRPARLNVGGGDVTVSTALGHRIERRVVLPPGWIRGFLQVQTAAALPSVDVALDASTVAELLSALRSRRDVESPRSLRFVLAPNEFPTILIEPWNIPIKERIHRFGGDFSGEIRIWGRRRLMPLLSVLPYAETVHARLIGTGMPSYWTVEIGEHRLDIGLSGWTKNDWSTSARFDMLSADGALDGRELRSASTALQSKLSLTPEALAAATKLSRGTATIALQRLCRQGLAMYDLTNGQYRWRRLLPVALDTDEEDARVLYAKRLVATGCVRWLKPGEEAGASMAPAARDRVRRYRAQVQSDEKRARKYIVVLDLDADGRPAYAQCTCSWHRREKLRKGPCSHILAASALASQENLQASAVSGQASRGAMIRPDRFKDQTIVFTGTLSILSRDQAESLVHQGGGRTARSISRKTTLVVLGQRPGGKLAQARELDIKVISEEAFQKMLVDSGGESS